MTISNPPTEWAQRRLLVQAIMDSLTSILDRKPGGPGFFSLRDILVAIDITLDTIRARVATQAFADDPPEAFWPPMRAVLDQFFPQLGEIVCGPLECDPAYEACWEPVVREMLREVQCLRAERGRQP